MTATKSVWRTSIQLHSIFEFLDLDYKTLNVTVNNEPADKNTKVYENFTVRTSSLEEYNENIMASEKLQDQKKLMIR